MSEVTIDDMNEAMAIFDAWSKRNPREFVKDGYMRYIWEFKYHTSWDELMPVVDKIERMDWCVRIENWPKKFPTPYKEKYSVWMWENPEDCPEIQTYSDSKIEAVYKAVYQFIQWYNKQQSNEQPNP